MTFDAPKRAEYLSHIRNGMRRGAAAEQVGLPRHVVDGTLTQDPGFAAELRDAELDATEHVEEALYQAAMSGNVSAARIWLERTERLNRRVVIPDEVRETAALPGDDGDD